MLFKSSQDVERRLADPALLTAQEVGDLFEWMNQISETGMRRLNSQLALQNLDAVQKFEKISTKLTKWLIGLTAVLVVLTIVIACYTVVLARKESPAIERQSASRASTKKTLGPWKAKFTIPGSAALPEQSPTVKCSFAKSADGGFGFISVTVANSNDEPYTVRYNIYGYDPKGRRISEGSDEFAIGKRETVLRSVFLKSEESVLGKLGSVFWIQMVLEDPTKQ
jgi:hypothetical protein